jgi:hypothetical protein
MADILGHSRYLAIRGLSPGGGGFAHTFSRLLDNSIQRGVDLDFFPAPGAEPAWRTMEKLFSDERIFSRGINPWASQPVVEINTKVMIIRDYFKLLVVERKDGNPARAGG